MSSTVRDYMVRDVVTLREGDPLRAAVELELVRRIRHIPVLSASGELLGILTDRDIKRVLPSPLGAPSSEQYESILDETPVTRVMTREPYTVSPDTPLADAVARMLNEKVGGLPVVENGVLVGMFTRTDGLRGYLAMLRKLDGGA